MIDEKCWSCDLLAYVFTEGIRETFTILTFILHTEFTKLGLHLCISRSKQIDTSLIFHGFEVVDLRPLSCEVEGVSFCRE